MGQLYHGIGALAAYSLAAGYLYLGVQVEKAWKAYRRPLSRIERLLEYLPGGK